MYNYRSMILIAFTILAMLAPHLADARAGGGRSMGSRGTKTYSTPSYSKAKPIERSTTAAPKPTNPSSANNAQPGFGAAAPAIGGGSPFWRGMAGGFLGAGIASMLFGHSSHAAGMDGGMGGGGGMIGSLLQILLIGGLIYFAIRMFRGNLSTNNVSPMNNFSRNISANNDYAENVTDNTSPISVTNQDKEYFEQLLLKIQQSWSQADLTRLRQYVTPEMLQYFSEELSANASRGQANIVENITLLKADIAESWHEFAMDYASANLQWSANDYMVYLDKKPSDKNYIASGSKTELSQTEEMWTFVRSSGGNWLLSAIQQVN